MANLAVAIFIPISEEIDDAHSVLFEKISQLLLHVFFGIQGDIANLRRLLEASPFAPLHDGLPRLFPTRVRLQ